MSDLKRPVNENGRRQLLGYLANERQSQDDTREWIIAWLDTWCPLAPEVMRRVVKRMKELEDT